MLYSVSLFLAFPEAILSERVIPELLTRDLGQR